LFFKLKTNAMINPEKFRSIYADFLESGLTVRAFCANHSMNEAKFYYWQQKLKSHLPAKGGFVPVVFGKASGISGSLPKKSPALQSRCDDLGHAPGGQTIRCEISYPNGVSIKLDGCTDAVLLRSLLTLNATHHV
jgi:hypothetical protein